MFLITTADKNFWKTDEDILFLGEWCKTYNQKQIWSSLRYHVLPYHWNDRNKLYNDYLYLDRINEKYLELLAERLNYIHSVDYSSRYWRIVIGYWLFQFIETLYDRYFSIKSASDSGLVSGTWISPRNTGNWTPNECSAFTRLVSTDDYNHYLYSRVIEKIGNFPYSELYPTAACTSGIIQETDTFSTQRWFTRFIKIYNHIPSRWNDIVFVCPYFELRDNIRLQLSLNQIPYFDTPVKKAVIGPVDFSLRKKIEIHDESNNEFERILATMIADQIPKEYLEGYASLHKQALETFPRQPKIIFTANAYHGDTLFQLWSAFHVENGSKLIGTPHGGHYGSGLWSASEIYQIRICDRYFSWGWEDPDSPHVIPMATGKFNGFIHTVAPDPCGSILVIENTISRYSYWMYSAPVGPQMEEFLHDQFRFVRSVSPEVYKALLVRLYPRDMGWNEKERFGDLFPTLKLYQGEQSIQQQLNKSRLCICTFNTTSYLETFSANFPTILFWDPRYWELRPSAQPFFDKLRKVGILHDTPESAAEKVNEIYKDPLSWWNQEEIQKTLKEFNHNFLRTSDNWLTEWKQEFQNILQETHK